MRRPDRSSARSGTRRISRSSTRSPISGLRRRPRPPTRDSGHRRFRARPNRCPRTRLARSLSLVFNQQRSDLQQRTQRLDRTSPSLMFAERRTRLAEIESRLTSAVHRHLRDAQANCKLISVRAAWGWREGPGSAANRSCERAKSYARVPRVQFAERRADLNQSRRRLVRAANQPSHRRTPIWTCRSRRWFSLTPRRSSTGALPC